MNQVLQFLGAQLVKSHTADQAMHGATIEFYDVYKIPLNPAFEIAILVCPADSSHPRANSFYCEITSKPLGDGVVNCKWSKSLMKYNEWQPLSDMAMEMHVNRLRSWWAEK